MENGGPNGIKSHQHRSRASKVLFFDILCGFEEMCFFMSFGLGNVYQQKKKERGGVGKQFDSGALVWEGPARTAVCWRGEGGDVIGLIALKELIVDCVFKSILFRIPQAALPKGVADKRPRPTPRPQNMEHVKK